MRVKDKKLMTTQVFFPFFFRKVLDGIAELVRGIRLEREDKKSFIPDGLFCRFHGATSRRLCGSDRGSGSEAGPK